MSDITIQSIAGYCNEKALWKLLVNLSTEMLQDNSNDWMVLMPDLVTVDGEEFRMEDKTPQNPVTEFYPPEGIENYGEAGFVWSLGALVCYASSGHYVFGGRGGIYQRSHPKVELPTLKKEHSALTATVKRCLCYFPSQRISLRELHTIAVKGLNSNEQTSRIKRICESDGASFSPKCPDDTWPEKMG